MGELWVNVSFKNALPQNGPATESSFAGSTIFSLRPSQSSRLPPLYFGYLAIDAINLRNMLLCMAEENKSTNAPTVDNILKNAQVLLATITELVESAKKAAGITTESQKQTEAVLADAKTKMTEIAAVATQAVAAKTQIADAQAIIATKSDHIQKAQEHADKVRADLDRALTAATQQATAAEGEKSSAEKSAETAGELLADVRTAKDAAQKDAETVAKTLKAAEASATTAKQLADKSETVEEQIAAYEKRLAELEKQCADQLKAITDLLPGATTAGLAHSFDDRRKTFLKPHNRWQWLFVASLLAIVALTATGLWQVYQSGTAPTYDELFRMWLCRLPIVGALVWLALYASREAALAKRLEEDYGYKSAIAETFLGFHKQMSEVGEAAASNKPLAKLCEDTLTTIASPPGRIYDKHKLTVTPADEFKEAAKAASELAKAVKNPAK